MSSPKSPGFCGEILRIASDDFCEHQPLMLTKFRLKIHLPLRPLPYLLLNSQSSTLTMMA